MMKSTFSPDTENEMFQLAIQLLNQSNRSIFLTGKAGTGKTTFLKYIGKNCPKKMVVVAPTGVAAINAGGVTIHSFFQLPFGPFIPESKGMGFDPGGQEVSNKHSLVSRLRFNSDKKKLLQELELLIIDEISMVRSDVLDAIDTVLRYVRKNPGEAFGGVQVLFIGDMMQLPPVVKPEEWQLLSGYYESQYFFDSRVLKEQPALYIEFSKIYRQSDESFINLLNQVRNNKLDETGKRILNSRFQPSFPRKTNDGYIILTTHNYKAADINARELSALNAELFTYKAEVKDEFSDKSFPADEILQLKTGAQVMFIRNDTAEKGKRYFNGKIGIVKELSADKITVNCDGENIQVQKETWENIRYTLNKSTRHIESEVLGSFTQYPLRLAWAITIHKSQGLTFGKAIIDAGESFAPGQVYVALSRCTNLEGMVLNSRIKDNSLYTDPRITAFSQRSFPEELLQNELRRGRHEYQRSIVLSCFDLSAAIAQASELSTYLLEHQGAFDETALQWTEELLKKLNALQATATKFQSQLSSLFQQEENNPLLQSRIKEGSDYFIPALKTLVQAIRDCPLVTDSYTHAKACSDGCRELFTELATKEYLLEGFKAGFDLDDHHRRKQAFVLPAFTINIYAGTRESKTFAEHPELQQRLRKLRDSICIKKDIPIYLVAGTVSLQEMTKYLPQTPDELRRISGFGKAKTEQYGQQFLDIIRDYCDQQGLSSRVHEKEMKKERPGSGPAKKKGETQAVSYRLYKEGKTVEEIAKERNLAKQTIEGHLARFVQSGEIAIGEMVNPEKIEMIVPVLKEMQGSSLTDIKSRLGGQIEFGEIRLVMASLGIEQFTGSK